MQAYLLKGATKEKRAEYIVELAGNTTQLIHIFAEKSSISIKQIQDLYEILKIQARIPRIIWIEEAGQMTVPAQNALLKMLEEPPIDTSFYLSLDSAGSVLPTILSRAETITLDRANISIDPQVLKDLKSIMSLSPGDRLIAITKRDRAQSIDWLLQIETGLSEKMKDPSLSDRGLFMLTQIAKSSQIAHLQLLSNCSVSLVTQNFYLTLPHTGSQG